MPLNPSLLTTQLEVLVIQLSQKENLDPKTIRFLSGLATDISNYIKQNLTVTLPTGTEIFGTMVSEGSSGPVSITLTTPITCTIS